MKLKWPIGAGQYVDVEPQSVVAGLDFGFGVHDPLALEIAARVGPVWINVAELYQSKLSIPDVLRMTIRLTKEYGIERIWADPEDPKMIELLGSHGLPILPNQVKDIDYGIRVLYGLMKMRVRHPVLGEGPRWRLNRDGCPNLAREMLTYAYPSVRGEFQTKRPLDRNNHGIDAVRYYIVGEGELPPDETKPSVYERPTMFVDAGGRWRDDPVATMAQQRRKVIEAEGPLWWDEQEAMEVEMIGGDFDDE